MRTKELRKGLTKTCFDNVDEQNEQFADRYLNDTILFDNTKEMLCVNVSECDGRTFYDEDEDLIIIVGHDEAVWIKGSTLKIKREYIR